MRRWYMLLIATVLLLVICGCDFTTDETEPLTDIGTAYPTVETIAETEPPVLILDSIEYWDVVQDEIVTMLNQNNLYASAITHAYPCVQFYVEPGIVTGDGRIVASGLSQAEYEELFERVKMELHTILDKYKLAKPKTAFHGCHSVVDIIFNNWFVDENKIYDNVYSRYVACYGLDLLEYYYEYKEDSYIQTDACYTDVWSKYPVYIP